MTFHYTKENEHRAICNTKARTLNQSCLFALYRTALGECISNLVFHVERKLHCKFMFIFVTRIKYDKTLSKTQ